MAIQFEKRSHSTVTAESLLVIADLKSPQMEMWVEKPFVLKLLVEILDSLVGTVMRQAMEMMADLPSELLVETGILHETEKGAEGERLFR